MLNDGFGASSVEDFMAEWEGFIRSYAFRVCADPSRREDVAQEGRVALWKAKTEGHDWPVEVAKSRMKQIAWYPHRNPPVGSVHEGNRYEPQTLSVQAAASNTETDEGFVEAIFGMVDTLGDVEWAYHAGEIADALASLTEKQRAYVYARFWMGMEGNTDAAQLAKAMNPQVNDRRGDVWGGRKDRHGNRVPGAREKLAVRLEHLRELVT